MDDEKYYDALREMFLTEGWAMFVDGIKNDIINLNNVNNVANEAELNFRKGQIAILTGIYNLEHTIKAQQENESSD